MQHGLQKTDNVLVVGTNEGRRNLRSFDSPVRTHRSAAPDNSLNPKTVPTRHLLLLHPLQRRARRMMVELLLSPVGLVAVSILVAVLGLPAGRSLLKTPVPTSFSIPRMVRLTKDTAVEYTKHNGSGQLTGKRNRQPVDSLIGNRNKNSRLPNLVYNCSRT